MTVAIITGASSGVGRDIAIVYAKSGINVVVAARSKDKLDKLVEELTQNYGGKHLAVETDLKKKESIKNLFEQTVASYGVFDIVVNNAGDAKLFPLRDYIVNDKLDEIDEFSDLLFKAPLRMHYYAILHLRKFLEEKRIKKGYIIDILSSAGQDFYPMNGVYGAAKHGISALSICNQEDEKDIAFIRIYPSNIETPLVSPEKAHKEVWDHIQRAKAKHGLLKPMDVAKIVGKLTEEGDSIDIYMEQKETGPSIARFSKGKPHYVPELTLVDFLKK